MANFTTMEDAEARCRSQVAAGTWLVAHVARNVTGDIIARFIRPMAPTSDATRAYGGWTENQDDSLD